MTSAKGRKLDEYAARIWFTDRADRVRPCDDVERPSGQRHADRGDGLFQTHECEIAGIGVEYRGSRRRRNGAFSVSCGTATCTIAYPRGRRNRHQLAGYGRDRSGQSDRRRCWGCAVATASARRPSRCAAGPMACMQHAARCDQPAERVARNRRCDSVHCEPRQRDGAPAESRRKSDAFGPAIVVGSRDCRPHDATTCTYRSAPDDVPDPAFDVRGNR